MPNIVVKGTKWNNINLAKFCLAMIKSKKKNVFTLL